MNFLKTILVALALAAGGCSSVGLKSLAGKETLKNEHGHVVGYKERLSVEGEDLDRVTLFTPRRSETGRVIAYEERIKGGVVLWDLRGKRIGSRYVDSRSRGTNPHSKGLTIVFVPRDAERLAQVHIAQVTIEDIKQHLNITN
jgi:hypothetical protein